MVRVWYRCPAPPNGNRCPRLAAMAEAEIQVRAAPAPLRGGTFDRAFYWLERLPGTAVPWIIAGGPSSLGSWGTSPPGSPARHRSARRGWSSEPSLFGIGVELGIGVLAAAFFVLPLLGIHGRLSAEKGKLLGNVNTRLKLTLDRIHDMVDDDDLGRADDLQKTQAALLAERDLYLRLSTWPWSTERSAVSCPP
jgi:hypothetical protein